MSSAARAGLTRMTTTLDLAPQAAEVARVVAAVRDDQLTDPTPCPGMPAAALLDHLVGLTLAFRLAAEKQPQRGGPSAAAATLAADWRERLLRQLDELVAAWRAPSAWEGAVEVGGVTMPAPDMAVVALDELVVHGWDLGRATNLGPEWPDEVLGTALEAVGAMAAQGREMGVFGPAVAVPDGAPLLDRVVALSGRTP